MKKTLKLYGPHQAQLAFHQSKARFRVASWGRQAGKSSACVNDLLWRAWTNPGHNFWFVSPTISQAKVQYRRLVSMLWPCRQVMVKKNQTELRVKLENMSQITFKSGEVLQNLRGDTLNGVVVDEVRDQPKGLWRTVLRPMLTTTKGWAAFVSTPNGFDDFYDFAERAKGDTRGKWFYMSAPSTCNPLFTQEEYDEAKKDMTEAEFAQEILAEFRDLTQGQAYSNFSEANISDTNPFTLAGARAATYLPLVLGCDFNVRHMSWVVMQNRARDWYALDEIALRGKRSHSGDAVAEFIARFPSYGVKANPAVLIVGDASGNAQKSSAAGQTDYTIITEALTAAGITWENRTPDANPPVKDRVNQVNAKLRSADGQAHLWFHPSCKESIADLRRVSWKPGATAVLDKSDEERTHASDAFGYPICALDPMRPNGAVGGLIVLRR